MTKRLLGFIFHGGRLVLQQVAYAAVEYGAEAGQDIDIQAGYGIAAVIVDLRPLHFCAVAQLVFAEAGLFDELVQFDPDRSVTWFHFGSPRSSKIGQPTSSLTGLTKF